MANLVDSLGTGLFLAGSALFFTRALRLSAAEVGVGLSLAGVGGILATIPVGMLADRIGSKRTIVALYLWRGCCFTAYPFARQPAVFFVLAFAIGAAEWSGGPVVQSIAAVLEGSDARVRTMAVISSVRNAGFSIGAVLATAALTIGNTRAFSGLVFADAATFFVAAALLGRLPPVTNKAGRGQRRTGKRHQGPRVRDLRFLALSALNGVLFLHTVLLSVALPLWIATRTTAPPVIIGAILVLNTIMAIFLQVPLSRGSSDLLSAGHRQALAGCCLAACCLMMALTTRTGSALSATLVIAAVMALTLGEIWQGVGAWRISYALAPADQRAYYLAAYQLGQTAVSAAGPALITWAVIGNRAAGWASLGAIFVLAGLGVVLITGRLQAVTPAETVTSLG
ncbi:MAG TPA: MFS transporter [Trebonia sp.]|nr:MFS transporter [Trebonia sp.]